MGTRVRVMFDGSSRCDWVQTWESVPRRDDHIVLLDDRRWIVSYVEWHAHNEATVHVREAWSTKDWQE